MKKEDREHARKISEKYKFARTKKGVIQVRIEEQGSYDHRDSVHLEKAMEKDEKSMQKIIERLLVCEKDDMDEMYKIVKQISRFHELETFPYLQIADMISEKGFEKQDQGNEEILKDKVLLYNHAMAIIEESLRFNGLIHPKLKDVINTISKAK